MSDRNDYVRELVKEVAPRVWLGMSGNGSLRIDIDIDTDVQCYGNWEPHGPFGIGPRTDDKVAYAQSWIEFFVRSTIYRLVDKGLLTVPESMPADIRAAAVLRVKLGEQLDDPAPAWVKRIAEGDLPPEPPNKFQLPDRESEVQ